jgi:hypothetical protein
MVKGKEIALKEALKIKLDENPLYHSLLAELYNGINLEKQISHLKIAIQLNQNKNDSFVLEKKLKEASKVHSEKSFNN